MPASRCLFLCVGLAAGVLAACSGGGPSGSLPSAKNTSGSAPHRARTMATVPSGSLTIGGQVAAINTTSKVINFQTGSPCGYIDAYYSSSTAFDPASPLPTAGQYIQVTGTGTMNGSCPNSVSTTAYVSTYASPVPQINTSGSVTAVGSDGYSFTMLTGTTHSTVVLNSQDDGTTVPSVGASVSVSGYGTIGRFIHATSLTVTTPTPLPSDQTHIVTWIRAFPTPAAGAYSGTASAAVPYTSWIETNAEGSGSYQQSFSNLGTKVALYVDINRTSGNLYNFLNPYEAAFAHSSCTSPTTANRVTFLYGSTTEYQVDPGSSTLQSEYVAWVQHEKSSGKTTNWDAVMEDDSGPLDDFGLSNYKAAPPCYDGAAYAQSTWIPREVAMEEYLKKNDSVPTIANGLSGGVSTGAPISPAFQLFAGNTGLIGGRMDDCYHSESGLVTDNTSSNWIFPEDAELKMATIIDGSNEHPMYECVASTDLGADAAASSSLTARIYVIASFLLTYDTTNTTSTTENGAASTSALREDFTTPSGLNVMPESQLIPQAPLVAAPTTVDSLQPGSGDAYVREYSRCYYQGTYVGACAVAVNPTAATVTNTIASSYTHTLVLSGSGVLDGGTASTSGPAPASTLASDTAVVMFP